MVDFSCCLRVFQCTLSKILPVTSTAIACNLRTPYRMRSSRHDIAVRTDKRRYCVGAPALRIRRGHARIRRRQRSLPSTINALELVLRSFYDLFSEMLRIEEELCAHINHEEENVLDIVAHSVNLQRLRTWRDSINRYLINAFVFLSVDALCNLRVDRPALDICVGTQQCFA